MIAYLKGELVTIETDYIIIDVNGVGYKVNVPASTIGKLPPCGNPVLVNTLLIVREDSQQLYGFLSKKEQDIFELLISISGIGPKGALAILSGVAIEELSKAIIQENLAMLTKIPGIGKKTAQRIVIELKDKLAKEETQDIEGSIITIGDDNGLADAAEALIALGYSYNEAKNVIRKVKSKQPDAQVEEIIKIALKELAKF